MFFVMKLSKLCNLRCTYCYEYDELANKERMPFDGLERFFATLGDHYLAEKWTDELSFVLHGGEPLLLPEDYLRSFVALQREHLGARGIRFRNSLQSNLYRFDAAKLDLLEELEIGLGISVDVFGDQRLNVAGKNSQERVVDNLQMLFDRGLVERLGVGLISVLHRMNIANVEQTYRFCESLGLGFRLLPMFSMADPPDRVKHLTLDPADVVEALKKVARAQLSGGADGSGITIYPIWNYFLAAIHQISGVPAQTYDPAAREWAIIVNTNGDAYNHGDAYAPEGLFGNVFAQPFGDVLGSEQRKRTLALRAVRETTCAACPYARSCTHVPIVEALPSERLYDEDGELVCSVVRPMIEDLITLIASDDAAMAKVADAVRRHAGETSVSTVMEGMSS